jgi:hypothetical protein
MTKTFAENDLNTQRVLWQMGQPVPPYAPTRVADNLCWGCGFDSDDVDEFAAHVRTHESANTNPKDAA